MKIINTNPKIHKIFFSIQKIYLLKAFILYLYTPLNFNLLILIITILYI